MDTETILSKKIDDHDQKWLETNWIRTFKRNYGKVDQNLAAMKINLTES